MTLANLHLLADYQTIISSTEPREFERPDVIAALEMQSFMMRGKPVQLVYAPFDHVNEQARIIIVGMTPGRVQARNALQSAQAALNGGKSALQAAAIAKVHASFSGPIRNNLIRLLDHIGIASLLGIQSTEELWGKHSDLVHFTSALRYPVFVDGQNWSGQPEMVRTPQLREWLEKYTGQELRTIKDAVIVPLGPKVEDAMKHLAQLGAIDAACIIEGLPHPSGANAERISYFLGDKQANLCSPKTNTAKIDAARTAIIDQVARLRQRAARP